MLKLLNPYSILAVLAVAGLLFGGGYVKGRMDGVNKSLKKELTQAAEVTKKTNATLTLKREVKHEGQSLNHSQLVDDMCANGWMRSSDDCSK